MPRATRSLKKTSPDKIEKIAPEPSQEAPGNSETTPIMLKYGGVDIEVLDQKTNMVPQEALDVILPDEDKRSLAIALNFDIATLLIGETGTGKTSAVRRLAFLRKQGYVRINMHGYNTPDELIGSKSVKDGATYYEDGILTRAMKDGHVVVLDEINATPPDCTFILHGLLDEDKRISLPNGDIIRPHKDFRFFATMNPDYEGTKSMNRAFMDRFNIILTIDVLPPSDEAKLIMERTGVPKELATELVTVAHLARKAYREQKTLTFVSTRSLLQWALLISKGLDTMSSYTKAILNKTSVDQRQAFTDFYSSVFKVNPTDVEKLDSPFITTKRAIEQIKGQIKSEQLLNVQIQQQLEVERRKNAVINDKLVNIEQTQTRQVDELEAQYKKILADMQANMFKKTRNQLLGKKEAKEQVITPEEIIPTTADEQTKSDIFDLMRAVEEGAGAATIQALKIVDKSNDKNK